MLELRLLPSGETIGPDDVLRVASCVRPFDDDGVMCGSTNIEGITPVENSATGRTWTPHELIVRAFEKGDVTSSVGSKSRVHDAAGLDVWPSSPFVQPPRGR